MTSHIRRGDLGTTVWVCVGFVWDPWYTDCFVLAGVVRCMVRLSVEDSIKLGEVLLAAGAVGKMSCGGTSCLSYQGKQSTSLSLSSSGPSLLLLLS